jgi:hypothetical protein
MTETGKPEPNLPDPPRAGRGKVIYREETILGHLDEMKPPYSVYDLAKHLLVSSGTIYRWMNEHPAFRARVEELRGEADDMVEGGLFKRAVGYEIDAKVTNNDNGREVIEIKHYPPDVRAAQVWLRARRPEVWKDTIKVEISHKHVELMEHAMSVLDLDESDYEEIIRG